MKNRQVIITPTSGLCNRVFVILSALRIAEKYKYSLNIFWLERTGRFGLPYFGPINSKFSDYFKEESFDELPIPINYFAVNTKIIFQDPVQMDIEKTHPENLPLVKQPDGKEMRFMEGKLTEFIFAPKFIDVSKDIHLPIIIQKPTKPFGIIENGVELDPMIKYINYIDKIGKYKKDDYLNDLSRLSQMLKPIDFIQNIINDKLKEFEKYNNVIGIHIRETDLERANDKNRKAMIKKIILTSDMKNNALFIASDSSTEWIYKEYPDINIIEYKDEIKVENSIEGSQHGIVDLMLLSKCNQIYGSAGSSFSMLAWIISPLQDYVIHS